jgi:hypothetical protein
VPVSSSMNAESLLEDDFAFKNNLHLGMTSQISPQW